MCRFSGVGWVKDSQNTQYYIAQNTLFERLNVYCNQQLYIYYNYHLTKQWVERTLIKDNVIVHTLSFRHRNTATGMCMWFMHCKYLLVCEQLCWEVWPVIYLLVKWLYLVPAQRELKVDSIFGSFLLILHQAKGEAFFLCQSHLIKCHWSKKSEICFLHCSLDWLKETSGCCCCCCCD